MKQSFRDLTVYKKEFDLTLKIFNCLKSFPKEKEIN